MDQSQEKYLSILGLSPEGLHKRLEMCGAVLTGLNCSPSAYGSRVHLDPGRGTEALRRIHECCAPFVAEIDTNPAELLVQSAQKRSVMMVFAESCTGGLAASLVTGIAGSSTVFWGSMVTYANEAKERVLGVSGIPDHGAVSEATVKKMAEGSISISGADAALAVSGIAGPGGGTPDKPVGTVWFAFKFRDRTQCLHCVFSGNRAQIRRKAAAVALAGLANQIDGALLDTGWIADYTFY